MIAAFLSTRAARRMCRMVAAFAALALAGAGTGAGADALDPKYDPSKLTTPAMRPIPKSTPERFVLKNGMVVYLLENHDLPRVLGSAYVKATPVWIPNDKVGLGTITGMALRSGGTAAHTGDWLDDRLAAIGASINTSISLDFANSGFNSLSENTSEVIGLWAELLQKPAFPEDKVELGRVSLRRSIAQRNDEMFSLLQRVGPQAVYGKDSPWARQPEYATVEAVKREDCAELHRKVFEPSRMVLAVYGDFDTKTMKKTLTERFGAWKGANVALPPDPPTPKDTKPRLVFAPKDDVTQSGIVIANMGFRADDPDYAAMDVYNTALGGGFQSRLFNKIRSERGLAYATGSNAGDGFQRPGVFLALSLTKSESTMVALDLLREQVRATVEKPFTEAELAMAKSSVENSFVFQFEQPSSVLFRSAYYEVVGYPQDFLQKYQQGVQAVTAQSVQEAARRKVHPEQWVAVVVGKEKDFDRKLETAGLPVERWDVSIPPPPSKTPAGPASASSIAKGQDLLRKASDLTGGAAAWKAVSSMRIENAATVSMQGQNIALTTSLSWSFPNKVVSVQKLPFGEAKQVTDGEKGWTSFGGQTKEEPKALQNVAQEWERSLFRLFGDPSTVEIQAADQPQTIDGVSYDVAYVKSEKVRDWALYFGPDGNLARMEFMGEGPAGPAKQTEVYSDWKPIGKVKYPHARKMLLDGKPFMESTTTAVSMDVPLDATTFAKP